MDKIIKEKHFLLCKTNISEYLDLITKDIADMNSEKHVLISTSGTDEFLINLMEKTKLTHDKLKEMMLDGYTARGVQVKMFIPEDVSSITVEMDKKSALLAYTEEYVKISESTPDYNIHVHWRIVERTEDTI